MSARSTPSVSLSTGAQPFDSQPNFAACCSGQNRILHCALLTMGNDDFLTDEHVADLLAKEAKDCSLKYSTMGMEAYTSSPSGSRFARLDILALSPRGR